MKVVDMHCDTISEIYKDHRAGGNASILENSMMIDLKKMQAGDYGLQNFAYIPIWTGRRGSPLNTVCSFWIHSIMRWKPTGI